jgi:hypothetical protein
MIEFFKVLQYKRNLGICSTLFYNHQSNYSCIKKIQKMQIYTLDGNKNSFITFHASGMPFIPSKNML